MLFYSLPLFFGFNRLLSVFAVCLTFQYSMSLCLPCIIPLLSKKATSTTEPIIPVTTFKINIKKLEYRNDEEPHESTTEGGVLSTVTENERVILP